MKIRIILTLVLSTLLFLSGCANKEADIATKNELSALKPSPPANVYSNVPIFASLSSPIF